MAILGVRGPGSRPASTYSGPVATPLGDFLRARRAQVDPADAGIRVTGVRRTPGLRREEVATLAGISVDYYLRLEQGRDRNPSRQVLESLARVFGLDPTATDYLLGLTTAAPGRSREPADIVRTGVLVLLNSLPMPAFVESRRFDVLAANPLATALYPSVRPGANRLRAAFLDPDDRARTVDWERTLGSMVAGIRTSVGYEVDQDPRLVELIEELSRESELFREHWARHDVKPLAGGTQRIQHPEVGLLELRREKLTIGDSGGQLLVIYHAEPGTESARSLALLGSLIADPVSPVSP